MSRKYRKETRRSGSHKSGAKAKPGLQRVRPNQRIHEIRSLKDRHSPGAVTSSSTQSSEIKHRPRALYRPLDYSQKQFRLLDILPQARGKHIECRLFRSSLKAPPAYSALSYTWGNSLYLGANATTDQCLISVNGQEFFVGSNLKAALLHIRDQQEPKTFWIDAICINQNDSEERNNQVRLMKRIYRKAYRVVSWLGREDRHSGMVMDLIASATSQPNRDQMRHLVLLEIREKGYDFFHAYKALFMRSYWYRAWIIQEIFSAQELSVQCGRQTVTWVSLVIFQRFLTDECFGHTFADGQVLQSMSNLHLWIRKGLLSRHRLERYIRQGDRFSDLAILRDSGLRENDKLRPLHQLLFDNWDAMAKEPHDKVYSLFRLASDADEYKITVNYEISVCQLYTSIVENYIRLEGNLFIILPRRFGDNPYNLPSWCPDWSSSKPASKLGNSADVRPFPVPKHRPPYCAAGPDSVPRVRFSYPGLIMNACGWLLDTIQETSRSARRPIIMEPRTLTDFTPLLLLLCFPWGRRRQPPIERRATDFDIWYAMHRRALPRFFSKGGVRARGTEYVSKAYERYCREKHEGFFDILLRATNYYKDDNRGPRSVARLWRRNIDMPERYSRVDEVMTAALREMTISLGEIKINENYACFFITQQGYMGLGPRDLRNDDLICILQGCEFPVVLRRVDYSFRLIGAAYVQGFMHGQLLKSRRAMNLLEVEFQIC